NNMRKLGYIDGQTARYEFRSDHGQVDRLPALAAELVRLKVDVIVAWFTPAVLAATQATRDIPIIMAAAGDAVASGLVGSLAHAGPLPDGRLSDPWLFMIQSLGERNESCGAHPVGPKET